MKTQTEIRRINCENDILEYLLTRKPVKNVNLRIKPEGNIIVSANRYVPVEFIDSFVKSKRAFINQALDKYKERKGQAPAPKRYVSGENYVILGKSLILKVIQGNKESVTSDGVSIVLNVKDTENFKRKKRLMEAWLKERQEEIFHEICQEIYPLFKSYHIEYPIIKIRNMTSRWGSCQTKRGIITLNSKLLEAPRSCIEYVVLHEFSHFVHPNHSKQFYGLVAKYMPDWKLRKKGLETIL